MASITLKNIPPEVHQALKERAKRNGRSMNQEALLWLRVGSSAIPKQATGASEQELQELREQRKRLAAAGIWLTDDEINRAKHEGRH